MANEKLLDKIHSPQDLKNMSLTQLDQLCEEIREKLICTVAKNGGHLASNLGVVELTVALHKVFNAPTDTLVWDVGHQCYVHKILTGRLPQLDGLRMEGGISGFPKRHESEYDTFNTGHSSTSISSAFGVAKAKESLHLPGKTIAVIGDGALSGGLAYEGLNNAGRFKKNFIVILNDNNMSISKNVGSMARYLAGIRAKPSYLRTKARVEAVLQHIPVLGKWIRNFLLASKSFLKNALYKSTLFEDMGFVYFGPFDGHNLKKLTEVFQVAQNFKHPVLIHVITKKGKGYSFAEKDPKSFHGISSFHVETGMATKPAGKSFSSEFGTLLGCMAEADERICAITAAMPSGTGLTEFSRQFKERFYDVGIAEEHAVTFAGGLAAGGMLPVFAVYSTFLQRSYDQLIHDAALQNLNVTLAIDRAGVVGEDGETHQGLFDVPFLNTIPNITVFSPTYFSEMPMAFDAAIYRYDGVTAVRYPRGGEGYHPADFVPSARPYDLYGDVNAPAVLVTYGRLFSCACEARERLQKLGIPIAIVKLNRIKPVDMEAVEWIARKQEVFFFEEGIQSGGVGEHVSYLLQRSGFAGTYIIQAVKDEFVQQASMESTLHTLELDASGMVNIIMKECRQ